MNTTVYLIRHSEKFDKSIIKDYKTNQNNLLKEEKHILSVEGERRALILSELDELKNIDAVYTSNCVRTLETAKYLLDRQKLMVTIDDRFDERRVGIPNDKEYPDWYIRQYENINFKTINGESLKDVRNRFTNAFNESINEHKGKRIAIFTHGNAIKFFLLTWCKLESIISDKEVHISYKGKMIIDKELNAPEIFKLTLNNNLKPINIERLEFTELNS